MFNSFLTSLFFFVMMTMMMVMVKSVSDWCEGLSVYPTTYTIPVTKLADGISLGGTVFCNSTNATEQTITLVIVGPSDKWFGIVFGTSMTHDAVVYTTGKKGNDPIQLYDYKNTGQTITSVNKDTQQDWEEISTVTDSGKVTLTYSRLLDTGDKQDAVFTGNKKQLDTMYAIARSGLSLVAQHAIQSDKYYTMDFVNGDIIATVPLSITLKKWHGGFMWFAWNLFAYSGIIAARFKTNIICLKGKVCAQDRWFFTHVWCMRSAVILAILGFITAVVAVNINDSAHFNSPHTIVGLVIFILAMLQPLNAVIRPHKEPNVASQPWPRYIWELIHKNTGRSIVVLSIFNVFTGLVLLDVASAIIILQIIFISVLGLSVFIFEIYVRFYKKEEREKSEEEKPVVEI